MSADAPHPIPPFAAIVRRWALLGVAVLSVFTLAAYLPYRTGWAWVDLPSHLLLQYLIGAAVLGAVGRYARFGWRPYVALSVCALLCVFKVGPYFPMGSDAPDAPQASLKILQANVLFLNKDTQRFRKLVDDEKPDIILLAEANSSFAKMLQGLKKDYPYQNVLPEDATADGIGIASRLKLQNLHVISWKGADMPAYGFSVAVQKHAVQLVSVHTPNPLHDDAGRDAALAGIANEFASAKGPFIVAGDFNATPWCPAMRDLGAEAPGLRNARIGRGLFLSWPTFLPFFMRIPIDQTLVSDNIAVLDYRLGPDIGSDHFPVISVLALKEAK